MINITNALNKVHIKDGRKFFFKKNVVYDWYNKKHLEKVYIKNYWVKNDMFIYMVHTDLFDFDNNKKLFGYSCIIQVV